MPVRPTLESVAVHARVSRQTVSNVINSPSIVSPHTADRVRRAIAELDYRPSRAARQLRTRRSMMLALRLEPDRGGINGSILDRFLHAVVTGAQAASYRVVLYTAADDDAEIAAFHDLLSGNDLDGFLLTSTHHGDKRTRWLSERRIPFCTFGRPWGLGVRGPAAGGVPAPRTAARGDLLGDGAHLRHSWVDVDGAAGTRAAVAHLVQRGHTRIAFLGWPSGSGVGDDRRSGWETGLRDAALVADPRLDARVDDDIEAGRAVAAAFLQLADPPTAVVCASDSLALGAVSVGQLPVGVRRLAVTGFDDTPVARAVGLTSVRQPLDEAAAECLQQILGAIARPGALLGTVLLEPSLAVRASTAHSPDTTSFQSPTV